jgi:hypothetical protein
MFHLDLDDRIYEAASRGLLRAYTTHKNPLYRRVVIVPESHPTFWDEPIHCAEYGFHVGYRKDWVWYDPFGTRFDVGPAVFLDTAPYSGMIIIRFRVGHSPFPSLAERIIEAEDAGLFRVMRRNKRDYGVILSARAFHRYTLRRDDFSKYGEPIAVRNARGEWETISGELLSEVAPEVKQ